MSVVLCLYMLIINLKNECMNKNVTELYNRALAVVLDEYGLTAERMFASNNAECVSARRALIMALVDRGLTDQQIADCTNKLRRCAVCKIRNKFTPLTEKWDVKMCIAHIKGM